MRYTPSKYSKGLFNVCFVAFRLIPNLASSSRDLGACIRYRLHPRMHDESSKVWTKADLNDTPVNKAVLYSSTYSKHCACTFRYSLQAPDLNLFQGVSHLRAMLITCVSRTGYFIGSSLVSRPFRAVFAAFSARNCLIEV